VRALRRHHQRRVTEQVEAENHFEHAGVGLGQLTADIGQQDFLRRQQAAGLQGQLQNQGALGGLAGLQNVFELINSGNKLNTGGLYRFITMILVIKIGRHEK